MINLVQFVEWYYGEDENFFITAIDNETGRISNYYHNKDSFNKYLKEIVKLNTHFKRSLYFTINGFKDKANCEVNIHDTPKKTKSNVSHIKSIVFDFDEPETSVQDCTNLMKILNMVPTYILQTSPKKFQVCYRLDNKDIDFKEYELVNKTLAKMFKSDINVCSIEKVFRLPRSINHKNGHQAEIKMFNPNISYGFSMFKDKLSQFLSSNEELKEYYDSLKQKQSNTKVKKSKATKKANKPSTKSKKVITSTKNTTVELRHLKKYQLLLKFNHDDASVVDILYIKERAKNTDDYDVIFSEIVSLRELLNKPIKRDLTAYYHDRAQFMY